MNDQSVFSVLSLIILVSGFFVIKSKNQVVSAVHLILNLFAIACLFALAGAHFAAAIQVLLYAGAIMVLFLFVIMLLNLKVDEIEGPRFNATEYGVLGLATAGFAYMAIKLGQGELTAETPGPIVTDMGNTQQLGLLLFNKFVWPFELASFLILMAVIAGIVIAKKEKANP